MSALLGQVIDARQPGVLALGWTIVCHAPPDPGGSLARRQCHACSTTRKEPALAGGTSLAPGSMVARIA